MAVNRYIFIFFFLLVWNFSSAQVKSSFPKDTIYVEYVDNENSRKIIDWKYWDYKESKGGYFSIRDYSKKSDREEYISLFYPYTEKADTLPISCLKNYELLNLKEINQLKTDWALKADMPVSSRNAIFKTYVIEIISRDSLVKYPVIWRNEGVIP